MDADAFLDTWSNPNNPAAYSGQNIVAKHIPALKSVALIGENAKGERRVYFKDIVNFSGCVLRKG